MTRFKLMILIVAGAIFLVLSYIVYVERTTTYSLLPKTAPPQLPTAESMEESHEPTTSSQLPEPTPSHRKAFQTSLTTAIDDFLTPYGQHLSLFYIDMRSEDTFSYNGHQLKLAASCSKLPWIIKLAYLIDQKELTPEETMTYGPEYFREGSGNIQFQPYGKTFTLYELLHELTDESDNIAFAMLYEKVAHTFPDPPFLSEIAPPPHHAMARISSEQLAYYLKYLFDNQQKPAMAHLINKLTVTNSDDEAGTNLAITDGRPVTNKVGWMPFVLSDNDVAYIHDPKAPYIVAIMTEGYPTEISTKIIEEVTALVDSHQQLLYHTK